MSDANTTTMTPQTFVITTKSKLSQLPVKNGQAIFVKDSRRMYYDWDDKRIAFHDIVELENDAARLALTDMMEGKLYLVADTCVLWQYRGESKGWHPLTTEPNVIFTEATGGFPSVGTANTLYVSGRKIYRYSTEEGAFIEMAPNMFVWGTF